MLELSTIRTCRRVIKRPWMEKGSIVGPFWPSEATTPKKRLVGASIAQITCGGHQGTEMEEDGRRWRREVNF